MTTGHSTELDEQELLALERSQRDLLERTTLGATIYSAMELLIIPGTVVEVRIPYARITPGNHFTCTMVGYFDNIQDLATEAAFWSGKAPGVYYSINPVNPTFLSSTVSGRHRDTNRLMSCTYEEFARQGA